jgi:hypothetical protein
MGKLSTRVLQEKSPSQGKERSGHIDGKDRDRNEDRRNVVLHNEKAVRRQEAKPIGQKEKDRQVDNRCGKQSTRDHRWPPLCARSVALVFGKAASCLRHRSILVREALV